MELNIRDERQMRALTGLSRDQFAQLLPEFCEAFREHQETEYEQGRIKGSRRRKPGGGAKGKLPTMSDKLFFVLYYYKVYPTFDVFGAQFDMARSKANKNLHKLSPILHETLVRMGLMPRREFKTPDELNAVLKGVDTVIIDATERAYRRSVDDAKQRDHFSGKKNAIC